MGNMAKALATGFIQSGSIAKENVYAFAPNQKKLQNNANEIGFTPVASLEELLNEADTLIMACKPYQIQGVLDEIGSGLKGKTLVSIAAGWDFASYGQHMDTSTINFQFVMPNTPAMAREGVFLF